MKRYSIILSLLVITLTGTKASAQNYIQDINPMDAQFFQNRYIANPAMAGINEGLFLNFGYRSQWSSLPGSPQNNNLTLDYRSEKVGLGFTIFNDKAGDLNLTKVMATYAYHIPTNSESGQFHLGMNLTFQKGTYAVSNLLGDPNDPNVLDYNNRNASVDTDFGAAYTTESFSIEGTVYNLVSQIKKDAAEELGADKNVFYLAAGYSFPLKSWRANTKLSYRVINNYDDIADLGLELLSKDDKVGFTGIYHTNKSTSLGVSYLFKNQLQFVGFYNTSAGSIGTYSNGTFEIALRYKFRQRNN